MKDLDFTGSSLLFPLGTQSDGTCFPYTGVLEGNNHVIKGLMMNNTDSKICKNSALFCSLENATVRNLVIDSSCSFTGSVAASLAADVTGSVMLYKITNEAFVNGSEHAGSLIGRAKKYNMRTQR